MGFLETNLREKTADFAVTIIKKATISRQFFFFWGGEKCWALACAKTTETSTTYKLKCYLFRTGDFVFKAPICFAISFGLGIVLHKIVFYQRSSFALLNNNELRNVAMSKLLHRALASAQFLAIIVWEHLVVLGHFLVAVTKFQDSVQLRDKWPTDTQNTCTFFHINAKSLTGLKARFWN